MKICSSSGGSRDRVGPCSPTSARNPSGCSLIKSIISASVHAFSSSSSVTSLLIPNRILILMRTALESIRESAGISNRFLAYSGTLAVVLSAMLSIFASRKIAKPILELTDISKRMTDLDFNAKYQSKGENEIDQLGEHINQLSHTLEKTISELKSANNELLIDIERKTQIDEMRKDFLSNVSHELKTPLALIQGYAEGLLDRTWETC